MAFYTMFFDINTLSKQVNIQLKSGTNKELLKISYSKVLKFFLKDGLEAKVYKVLIVVQVNLSYYVFFKVVLRGILSINSVPKSRDFLSPFGVHISGLEDIVLNKVEL